MISAQAGSFIAFACHDNLARARFPVLMAAMVAGLWLAAALWSDFCQIVRK